MIEFIRRIIDQKTTVLRNDIIRIMQSEAFKLLESFYNNQSWDLIKNKEIVLGYNDIEYLVNKDSEKFEVIIEQLYKSAEKQVHLVVAHKKFGHADLLFSIEDFFLSADKASVTFSYHINNLTPFSDIDFWDKIKIYGANLVVKLFPETVNKKMFDQKELAEGVLATVLENKITIEFLQAIKNSPLEQKKLLGYSTLDIIQIIAINIRDKGFGVRFNIDIPEWFKNIVALLISAVIQKKFYKTAVLSSKTSSPFLRKLLPF